MKQKGKRFQKSARKAFSFLKNKYFSNNNNPIIGGCLVYYKFQLIVMPQFL